MTDTAPRKARLQAIRDRWFSEPLKAKLMPLTDSDRTLPATCDEFVRSSRLLAAFSTLHHAPDAAGMSREDALEHDRELNSERYGIENPPALLQDLSRQFDRAPTGQIDPDVLKKAFVLLETLRHNSAELAVQTVGKDEASQAVHAAHQADADALTQASGMVQELAGEVGIALPLNRSSRRDR
ncbi:MAG TPA: hypothetical protein VH682_25885 [Gemmataceae bacterium]|jgi:hypothetical protein